MMGLKIVEEQNFRNQGIIFLTFSKKKTFLFGVLWKCFTYFVVIYLYLFFKKELLLFQLWFCFVLLSPEIVVAFDLHILFSILSDHKCLGF